MSEKITQMVERKICQLLDFIGDHLKAFNFLNTNHTYLYINQDAYPTEEDKIIFVLFFMKGGMARL